MAEDILKRLRYDNHTIETVTRLVKYHDYGNGEDPEAGRVRRAINKIGEDIFPLLFYVKRADIMAQREEFRADKLARLEAWEQSYEKILRNRPGSDRAWHEAGQRDRRKVKRSSGTGAGTS